MERSALVTGAAGGIGRAICAGLWEAGFHVIATDVADDPGLPGVSYIRSDLTSLEGCEALAATAREQGPVAVLVNNAGVQHLSPISRFPDAVWERMLALMLTAPFRLSRLLWADLVADGAGRIVNIASIHGLVASPEKAAYVTVKHGLLGLTKVQALEGGPYGLTANAICPSYVRTPLVERQLDQRSQELGISRDQVADEVMLAPLAVKRFVEPGEIAGLVAFLCSPAAASMTGAPVVMDGGWTAR
jgi:3-hydroxybutyrate dehydrogenase